MKYVKRLLLTLLLICLLSVITLEVFYRYKINEIQPEKSLSSISYSQAARDIQWIAMGEKGEPALVKLMATEFVFNMVKCLLSNVPKAHQSTCPKHYILASYVARHLLETRKYSQKDAHINNMIVAIWVTHHYTAKEAADYVIDTAYYGKRLFGLRKAAEYYYGKNVDQLTLSELTSALLLPTAPSIFNPHLQPKNHQAQAEELSKKVRENWPLKYREHRYVLPVFKY